MNNLDKPTEKRKISAKNTGSSVTPILAQVDKEILYENMTFKERRQAKKEEKLASKGVVAKEKPKKEAKEKKAKVEPIKKEVEVKPLKTKVEIPIIAASSFASDTFTEAVEEPVKHVEVKPIAATPIEPINEEEDVKKVKMVPQSVEIEYFDEDEDILDLDEGDFEEPVVAAKSLEEEEYFDEDDSVIPEVTPIVVTPIVTKTDEPSVEKSVEEEFGTASFDSSDYKTAVRPIVVPERAEENVIAYNSPVTEEPLAEEILVEENPLAKESLDQTSFEEEYFDDDDSSEMFEEDMAYEEPVEEKVVEPVVKEAVRVQSIKAVESKKPERVEKVVASVVKEKKQPLEQFEKDYLDKFSEKKLKKEKPIEKMRRIQTNSILIRFAIQAAVVIIFFTVVIRNTIVMSGSMEPTLVTGDYAIYNKLAYKFVDVQRGDIINFWSDEQNEYLSKRVIGVAGDTIEFHDGYVFINGHIADESAYLDEDVETNSVKSFLVPDNCVFVLGDNRERSYDSRYFLQPYIPIDKIVGKYIGSVPKFNKK